MVYMQSATHLWKTTSLPPATSSPQFYNKGSDTVLTKDMGKYHFIIYKDKIIKLKL